MARPVARPRGYRALRAALAGATALCPAAPPSRGRGRRLPCRAWPRPLLIPAMIAGRWIEDAQNLIIEGPAGVGKSWLACALGHKACRDNRSVLYQRIPRMFGDLALARGDGRYPRLMRALGGVKLLILDDRSEERRVG